MGHGNGKLLANEARHSGAREHVDPLQYQTLTERPPFTFACRVCSYCPLTCTERMSPSLTDS